VLEMTRPEPTTTGRPVPRLPAAPTQRILAVEFRSHGGRHWYAIGGGASLAAAIIDARQSCPDDATWESIGWNDLYGD
jgi:hypothetical protein